MNVLTRMLWSASVFAVDPQVMGGVCLRSRMSPVRDRWLTLLRELLPAGTPWRRMPYELTDSHLLGGMDIPATLRKGSPVVRGGVLAGAHRGILTIAMAERLSARTVAQLGNVLDFGRISLSREGVTTGLPAEVAIIALDEGADPDEQVAAALRERTAFWLDLEQVASRVELNPLHTRAEIALARARFAKCRLPAATLRSLCATSFALGIDSPRAVLLAAAAARAVGCLQGRGQATEEDAAMAAALVLAHRATQLPAPADAEAEREAEPQEEPSRDESTEMPDTDRDADEERANSPEERLIQASAAAIPEQLLRRLQSKERNHTSLRAGGAGALRTSFARGRPAGVRAASTRGGPSRLNLIATLQAAAPWQRLRGRKENQGRVRIEVGDFRVTRYRQRAHTLILFSIDASGSAALHRLAEAKGAVELILNECYVRRDQVAVVGFREQGAQVLLAPTRSLVMAKRRLAGLPGGGGTPLAAGISVSLNLALQAKRRGDQPSIVFLTDGRANIARDGSAGRETARADAFHAARELSSAKVAALLIDTSPRPSDAAARIADAMGALYMPLPHADSRQMSGAINARLERRNRRMS